MADVQRHRSENANPRYYAVDSATVISVGDMCWLDTNDAKPAYDFAWDTDLATTQRAFAQKFVGMSQDRSQAGETDEVSVAKNGVFEFDCASATFEVGDLVGPTATSTNLDNQKVVAVATEDLAIGRVYQREASAVTKVKVQIITKLDFLTLASTPAEIKTSLETLTGDSRLNADYIKDGSSNKFVSRDNAGSIRDQLETLTTTSRLNADSVKDGTTNKFVSTANAGDIKTALETLTTTARLDADSVKDGSTNKFVATANAGSIRDALETLTTTSRLNADNVKDGSTNKFISSNVAKISANAHTVTSDEATATQYDYNTGWGIAPDVFIVNIIRANVDVKGDAVVSALGGGDAGKVRIASGSATYTLTAGDVVQIICIDVAA